MRALSPPSLSGWGQIVTQQICRIIRCLNCGLRVQETLQKVLFGEVEREFSTRGPPVHEKLRIGISLVASKGVD